MSKELDAFRKDQGDLWFERNLLGVIPDPTPDAMESRLIQVLQSTVAQGSSSVLCEVGCSRGDRLWRLSANLPYRCVGLDVSAAAISEGRRLYRDSLDLIRASADNTGLQDEFVRVLFFGWVLCYASMDYLEAVTTEAKRVLEPNGMLAVFDFDFGEFLEREFSHLPTLSTYRHDYLSHFGERGFRLIDKASLVVGDNDVTEFGLTEDRLSQCALWIFCRSS